MVGRLWRTIRRLGPECGAFPTGILGGERVRREGAGRDSLGKGRAGRVVKGVGSWKEGDSAFNSISWPRISKELKISLFYGCRSR